MKVLLFICPSLVIRQEHFSWRHVALLHLQVFPKRGRAYRAVPYRSIPCIVD